MVPVRKLVTASLLTSLLCVASDSRAETDRVRIMGSGGLKPQEMLCVAESDRLLLMIPGISSGDLGESVEFLERVREQGGYDVAIFYDWERGNFGRKTVSRTATEPAARLLLDVCAQYLEMGQGSNTIDVIAHSAGTVVLNKAAIAMQRQRKSVRFRHVLFLGTALDAREPLDQLMNACESICNAHSVYDKVNRNINDNDGVLVAFPGGSYQNVDMDTSISGRLMRHYVFLASNPENWLQYGAYLGDGEWLEGEWQIDETGGSPLALHRSTLQLESQSDRESLGQQVNLPRLLADTDPAVRYYGVIMEGLLKDDSLLPDMMQMLEDDATPVYIRKEIYQAIGALEDGRYVDFLREAVRGDAECSEEVRDVVRTLKRKRISPVR